MTTINDWKPESISLLETLQKHGVTILSVDNGESKTKFDADDLDNFIDEMTACDEAYLTVSTSDGAKRVLYLVYGNDPGELVCDYSVSPELDDATARHYENWEGKPQPTTVLA